MPRALSLPNSLFGIQVNDFEVTYALIFWMFWFVNLSIECMFSKPKLYIND